MTAAAGRIICEGTWLYAGSTPAGVRIRVTSIRYGTGDYEDPPDLRDDAPLVALASNGNAPVVGDGTAD